MRCREARRMLLTLLDETAEDESTARGAELSEHLASCRRCAAELDQLRMASSALARDRSPVRVPDGLAERIVRSVRVESLPARSWSERWLDWPAPARWQTPILASAAAVLLIIGLNLLPPPVGSITSETMDAEELVLLQVEHALRASLSTSPDRLQSVLSDYDAPIDGESYGRLLVAVDRLEMEQQEEFLTTLSEELSEMSGTENGAT